MLSEKVNALCVQLLETQRQLDAQILEETNGLMSLCKQDWIHVYVSSEINSDRAAVEAILGPMQTKNRVDNRLHCYFKLGEVNGVVLIKTSDSRGESDDVSVNTEA